MPPARRKHRKTTRHGRQHATHVQLGLPGEPPEGQDVLAAIDRARAASTRALTPALRGKLDESWGEFRRELDRLKAEIAKRRKKLDEKYGEQLRELGADYDKARRRLEAENDERRERILRLYGETEAA